jgi:hypothetical protein
VPVLCHTPLTELVAALEVGHLAKESAHLPLQTAG